VIVKSPKSLQDLPHFLVSSIETGERLPTGPGSARCCCPIGRACSAPSPASTAGRGRLCRFWGSRSRGARRKPSAHRRLLATLSCLDGRGAFVAMEPASLT